MAEIEDAIVVSDNTVMSMVENSRSTASIVAMKKTIDEIVRAVMKPDVHYGMIPGTNKKPTLFQAGADCLATTFKIAFQFENEDLGDGIDEVRYRSRCVATWQGEFLGDCLGEASSFEEKYKWRAIRCIEEWEATPDDMRRLRYYKKGDPSKQIRVEPADIINTILKMAQKRAKLGCIKTVLAISDIFEVDIDSMPKDLVGNQDDAPTVEEPKRKSEKKKDKKKAKPDAVSRASDPDEAAEEIQAGVDANDAYTGKVTAFKLVKETADWTLWAVEINGNKFVTFDAKVASTAQSALAFKTDVRFDYKPAKEDGKDPQLTDLVEL